MDRTVIRFPVTVAVLATVAAAVVTSVANRGEASPEVGALGNLDCGRAAVVDEVYDYVPGYAGHAAPALALSDAPGAAGAELVSRYAVSSRAGAVRYAARVDGRLVAVATVRRNGLGGWVLDELLACTDLTVAAGVAS